MSPRYAIRSPGGVQAHVSMSGPPSAEQERALGELADAAAARMKLIDTCHERRICPTCMAPIGVRCRAMPKGYVVGPRGGGSGRELKQPHEARWTMEVPRR